MLRIEELKWLWQRCGSRWHDYCNDGEFEDFETQWGRTRPRPPPLGRVRAVTPRDNFWTTLLPFLLGATTISRGQGTGVLCIYINKTLAQELSVRRD